MKYYSRRWIKPTNLNGASRLFGGQLLSWIDEEAAIYSGCQMQHEKLVTKYISEIDFLAPAVQGDVIEFGLEVVSFGRTSLTVACRVRNKVTHEPIIQIERMVFVAVDEDGKPVPHGYTGAIDPHVVPTEGQVRSSSNNTPTGRAA